MKDVAKALAALKRDKNIARLIKKHGKPDFTRRASSSVFPALLRAIIFQQLSGHAARAIHGRVLALFPKEEPAPKTLLKTSVHKLRAAGLSIQKISYVRDLAKKCIDGTIDERLFAKMSSAEIVEHVTRVHGIGEWTAHMLLIFTLHRSDILPVGDLGVRKGFRIAYNLKSLPDKKKMEQLATEWREHASVASWYFWAAADDAKR